MRINSFTGSGLVAIRGERRVFEGLDFALASGEALVLEGANGSGKSSLLRLMAGLGRPAAGRLDWDGAPVADEPEAHRARLHYVGHLDAIRPAMTVAETLRFWCGLAGQTMARVPAALDALGLAALADQPGRYLSAGQRRRLALARLAAWEAPLWLLDEPTVGLDEAALQALAGLLEAQRRAGGMIVLSTHGAIDLASPRHLSLAAFQPQGITEPA